MSSGPSYPPYNNEYGRQQQWDNGYDNQQQYVNSAPEPPLHRIHPAAHPSSSFQQMQDQRQDGMPTAPQPARPSPSRSNTEQGYGEDDYAQQRPYGAAYSPRPHTPQGGDAYATRGVNYGAAAAGGGMAGAAYDFSDNHPREGGMQPFRDLDNLYNNRGPQNPGYDDPFSTPGSTPSLYPQDHQGHELNSLGPSGPYGSQQRRSWYDGGGNRYDSHSISRPMVGVGDIDPNAIADDGDDGLSYGAQHPNRRSMLNLGRGNNSRSALNTGAAAGAGAVAAGVALNPPSGRGVLGHPGSRDASGAYTAMPGGFGGPAAAGTGGAEKAQDSEWLASQTSGRKRLKWIVGSILVVILILAIGGGIAAGVIVSKNNSDGSSGGGGGESAAEDDGRGDLGKDSSEIKALMNNKDLHKVFPGVDYSPINTQYPDCLTNPPSQNNVTRDMAVLSQLTNTLRLYGTDCNQTEMSLHAIERLGLTDMKLWLGVWLGGNDTTNDRQINAMWDLLDKHGADPFVGVAVGNEVLFREEMTPTELGTILADVKKNLTAKNFDLPVATSDLGSNWDAQLASEVDVVMANVHPFFAGVTAEEGAGWTWDFWQNNDVAVAQDKKNVISEVGWPSAGGNDCGERKCQSDKDGSVASIENLNRFMEDWVCQALDNGTDYFWFEAFDEPWKIQFNDEEAGEEWEDKWGLMDVNRKLKDGVTIPDCGGKTISKRK